MKRKKTIVITRNSAHPMLNIIIKFNYFLPFFFSSLIAARSVCKPLPICLITTGNFPAPKRISIITNTNKICQKLGEEATETVIAALAEEHEDLLEESADLLYHLLVLWAAKGVHPNEVYDVLYRRRVTADIKKRKKRTFDKKI